MGCVLGFSKMRAVEPFNSTMALLVSLDTGNNASIVQSLEDVAAVLLRFPVLNHHSFRPLNINRLEPK